MTNRGKRSDSKTTVIGFAGDVLVDREDPPSVFKRVQTALDATDILFGNLEGPYSDDPHMSPSAGVPVIPAGHNVGVFGPTGFDVMSMANNHIVDAGHDAMLDTARRLNEQGVATCGVGRNLTEARRPAIVEADGVRVAFLAYASVFPSGYEARSNVPGLAPVRGYNHYHDRALNYQSPGTPPIIESIPDRTDLANLREDIRNARELADLVVTSFHWGDFMLPFHLTDHETQTAHFCIDEGADIVVGHHHHLLRGIEWYAGKPIFYGLGHFVFDVRIELSDEMVERVGGDGEDPDFYGIAPRKGWPLLPLHAESHMTALALVTVADGAIAGAGFLPCMLNPEGEVFPVDLNSPEGREVVDYIRKGCTTQGLNARLETEGGIELGGHPTVRVLPISS